MQIDLGIGGETPFIFYADSTYDVQRIIKSQTIDYCKEPIY